MTIPPIDVVPVAEVVLKLVSWLIDLVGHESAKQLLDAEAIKRQEALADAAEDLKFPKVLP